MRILCLEQDRHKTSSPFVLKDKVSSAAILLGSLRLTPFVLASHLRDIRKQCRLQSDAAFCGVCNYLYKINVYFFLN